MLRSSGTGSVRVPVHVSHGSRYGFVSVVRYGFVRVRTGWYRSGSVDGTVPGTVPGGFEFGSAQKAENPAS